MKLELPASFLTAFKGALSDFTFPCFRIPKSLCATNMKVRLGSHIRKTSKGEIGTPQGDALLPLLFAIYLNEKLKENAT